MDSFFSFSLLNLSVSLYFTLSLTCRAFGSGTQDDESLEDRGQRVGATSDTPQGTTDAQTLRRLIQTKLAQLQRRKGFRFRFIAFTDEN